MSGYFRQVNTSIVGGSAVPKKYLKNNQTTEYKETGKELRKESFERVPETYNSNGKTIKQEEKGYNMDQTV